MSKKKIAVIIVACIIGVIVGVVIATSSEPTPPTQTYTLTINISPSGAGSVSPSGGEYESGVQVTLTATPASGYTFYHWSGSASGTTPTITITMDSDKGLTAHFGVAHPVPGDWIASTRSSEFTFSFTVNSDGTGISKHTLEFEEFGFCAGYRVGKMTSATTGPEPIPIHPLPNGEFSLVHNIQVYSGIEDPPMGGPREIRIYWHIVIEGKFDETGTHASGTWEISSEGPINWWEKPSEGIICEEGIWEASR